MNARATGFYSPRSMSPADRARLDNLLAEQANMAVKENIPEGGYFIMHDIVYEATDAILKGEEAKPGKNCVERNLNEIKKQEE